MESEINEMLDAKRQAYLNPAHVDKEPVSNQKKLQELQDSLNMNNKYHSGDDLLSADEKLGFSSAPNGYGSNTQDQNRSSVGALPY